MRHSGLPRPFHRIRSGITFIALGAAVAAAPAYAGSRGDYDARYRYDNDRYQERYDSARPDYAQVVSARPIYRQVRVSEPRRECWDEQVTYREPNRGGDNVAGAILGGIIGGVAGHQVGGGRGRDVATGVGAVVGASIGSQAGQYNRGGYTRTGYETRCNTVDNTRIEQRVDGYDVTYRYNGQIYNTTMPYDPGNRIPVNVDVQPIRY